MIKRLKSSPPLLALVLGCSSMAEGLSAAEESAEPAMTETRVAPSVPDDDETAPSREMKTWDALVVRPISAVATAFSAATFVLTIPFNAIDPVMEIEETSDTLVGYPLRNTFKRPLGDFNGSVWSLDAATAEGEYGSVADDELEIEEQAATP